MWRAPWVIKTALKALDLRQLGTGRITSAKWIGDSANHSYRVKVNEVDLDRAITGLRLFLQEIL